MVAGLNGLFACAPVAFYLVALMILDGYQLVRLRLVLLAITAGIAALLLCRVVNSALWDASGLSLAAFTRYVAPVTEETAKAVYVAYLIARRRTGFMIDAAILGFAVGAGFGLLENVFYLSLHPDASPSTWVLRGFGTAVMHGCVTAIFGIVAHRRSEAGDGLRTAAWLPALGLSVVLHSGFNHFFVSPVLTAAGLTIVVPTITYAVFRRGERALESWLGVGFDSDAEMLAIIASGKVSQTRVGAYLASLRAHFSPDVVVDMFCLLRLQVELSIQSKGLLLMRKEGFAVSPPADIAEKIAELRHLERSIGPTGRLALRPFLAANRKDSWQKHLWH